MTSPIGSRPVNEPSVRVVLLVIPDCPNSAAAAAVLSDALVAAGRPRERFATALVYSLEDAELHGFIGSPSIHVDGRDILPIPGAPAAVACRKYVHADGGLRGIPDAAALSQALEAVLRS